MIITFEHTAPVGTQLMCAGAPGLGPISMRKEIVVFKEGFRSRQYCLSECAQVCSLSIQGPPSQAASRQQP